MSISVDYFFNHSHDLPALAGEINRWVGISLSPYEGNPEDLFGRFLGMELSLSKHNFENDGWELNFEDYTYYLGIRSPMPDADLRGLIFPTMSLLAFVLFHRMKITGMLVYDMQRLITCYKEKLNPETGELELYDTELWEVVRFPEYLNSLRKRSLEFIDTNHGEA